MSYKRTQNFSVIGMQNVKCFVINIFIVANPMRLYFWVIRYFCWIAYDWCYGNECEIIAFDPSTNCFVRSSMNLFCDSFMVSEFAVSHDEHNFFWIVICNLRTTFNLPLPVVLSLCKMKSYFVRHGKPPVWVKDSNFST